ncbi:hypothetical protein D3C72_632750 [compost metagenome]
MNIDETAEITTHWQRWRKKGFDWLVEESPSSGVEMWIKVRGDNAHRGFTGK